MKIKNFALEVDVNNPKYSNFNINGNKITAIETLSDDAWSSISYVYKCEHDCQHDFNIINK